MDTPMPAARTWRDVGGMYESKVVETQRLEQSDTPRVVGIHTPEQACGTNTQFTPKLISDPKRFEQCTPTVSHRLVAMGDCHYWNDDRVVETVELTHNLYDRNKFCTRESQSNTCTRSRRRLQRPHQRLRVQFPGLGVIPLSSGRKPPRLLRSRTDEGLKARPIISTGVTPIEFEPTLLLYGQAPALQYLSLPLAGTGVHHAQPC